jgi:enterochelin esterase-like enzyme
MTRRTSRSGSDECAGRERRHAAARVLRLASTFVLLIAALPAGAVEPLVPERVRGELQVQSLALEPTTFAPEGLRVTVYLPPDYALSQRRHPVLYLNDGQNRETVGLQATLQRLIDDGAIRAPIVVAIDMPRDRMAAYGLSDRKAGTSLVAQTKYGPVGTHAHAYSEWVAHTLVPAIDARYRTRPTPDARAILGWSLGGLNAFNLGWQYPEVFGRAGAFSPSFWLSAERGDADAVQRTRLAQRMIDRSEPRNGARWFFAVGSDEETDDRDGDGINDAIDDTRDLIDGWNIGQPDALKGLRQAGYSINHDHATRPSHSSCSGPMPCMPRRCRRRGTSTATRTCLPRMCLRATWTCGCRPVTATIRSAGIRCCTCTTDRTCSIPRWPTPASTGTSTA